MKKRLYEYYDPDESNIGSKLFYYTDSNAYPFLINTELDTRILYGKEGTTHNDILSNMLYGHDMIFKNFNEIQNIRKYDTIEGRIWIFGEDDGMGELEALITTWDYNTDKDIFLEVCKHFNVDPHNTLYGYDNEEELVEPDSIEDLDTFIDNELTPTTDTKVVTTSPTDNDEEREKKKKKHMLPPSEKWKETADFRDTIARKNAEKLGNMTMAQYHNLIYQEEKQYHPEEQDEFTLGLDGDGTALDSMHVVQESRYPLYEGKDRKQQARKKTKNVIKVYFNDSPELYQPNADTQGAILIDFLEQECMHDFFHSRTRSDEKGTFVCLEPMVMNIILHAGWQQGLPDGGVIARLESILNYIEELYSQQQIDPKAIVGYTMDDLEREFGSVIDEREAAAQAERAKKTYIPNENYTILDDVDYKQAHEIGNYSYSGLRLCYTQSEDTWTNSFHGDRNKVYVALSNGWKNVPEEHGESLLQYRPRQEGDEEEKEWYPDANAYDEYGLSMIFIFVDPDDGLAYSNTRWNHEATYGKGRSVDHAFTKDDLSDLLGYNFEKRFVGYTEEELKAKGIKYTSFKKVLKLLAQGVDPNEIFDFVHDTTEGFRSVRLNYKMNYLTQDNKLLSPNLWFDSAGKFYDGFAIIIVEDKYNYINTKGQLLSPNLWFDEAESFKNGFAQVQIGDKGWNYINTEGQLLSINDILAKGVDPNNIFDVINSDNEGFRKVTFNGECNYLTQDNQLLSPNLWFYEVKDFYNGFGKVKIYNKGWNFINTKGQLLSPNLWFDRTSYFCDGFAKVKINDKGWNYITTEGQILSPNLWFDYEGDFKNGFATIEGKGWNFISTKGQILSDMWFDRTYDFYNGFAGVKIDDKGYNLINTEGQLLSPNLWFDNVWDFDSNGYARVGLDSKYNFINTEGQLLSINDILAQGVDPKDIFDGVYQDIESCTIVEIDDTFNVLTQDNKLLFPNMWFNVVWNFVDGFAKVRIKNKYNFINTEGQLLSPNLWFDNVDRFNNGFAKVKINGKGLNFINAEGQILSPNLWFNDVSGFCNGFSRVCIRGIYGYYVNTEGQILDRDGNPIQVQESKQIKKIYINEDKLPLLRENATDILYHFTRIDFLISMMTDDKFIFKPLEWSQHPPKDGYKYYMSTTRQKDGRIGFPYSIYLNTTKVRLSLDGRLFNDSHQFICKPMDYFGVKRNSPRQSRKNVLSHISNNEEGFNLLKYEKLMDVESEDRIYSKTPTVSDAHKFITRIDIFTHAKDDDGYMRLPSSLYSNLDRLGLLNKTYIYENENEFDNQSKVCKSASVACLSENIEFEVSPQEVDTSSFEVQDKLQPEIWRDNQLNPKLRLKLLDIADDFYNSLDIPWIKPKDIILTGSICNFNWSQYSDIDLHIVVDFKEINDRTDFVQTFFDSKKNEWNDKHTDLEMFGFPVELYVQDINADAVSSGIYSLEKNAWIKEPNPNEMEDLSEIDDDKLKIAASSIMTIIDDIEDEYNTTTDKHQLEVLSDKIDHLCDKLKGLRQSGLNSNGEMSIGNLVYKVLRRTEYLDKIWKISDEIYDKVNSINEERSIKKINEV